MRTVSVTRRSAVKAKTQAINQPRAILVSAPQDIRERLWKPKADQCVAGCAHLQHLQQLGTTTLLQTLTTTLRLLAKRWLILAAELKELDATLEQLTKQFAPHLREQFCVGPQTAATLIAVAGDNPERLHSEAALAALCGVNPLPASSDKTIRHRLNRGGDRQPSHKHSPVSLPFTQPGEAWTHQIINFEKCIKLCNKTSLQACKQLYFAISSMRTLTYSLWTLPFSALALSNCNFQ